MTRAAVLGLEPRRFTVLDALLIAALLCSGSAFIPFMVSLAPGVAVVYRDNTIVAQYPLSSAAEFFIKGAQGGMRVKIADGALSVMSSQCPRQICRHTGSISRPFEQIVCVPNHLLVEVRSGKKRDIDAVAR
jgi:hypothetical protein